MKRSEMLIHMQRAYGIRYVMVETGHLSIADFMDEMLTYIESKGMLPPTCFGPIPTQIVKEVDKLNKVVAFESGQAFGTINQWEPENE